MRGAVGRAQHVREGRTDPARGRNGEDNSQLHYGGFDPTRSEAVRLECNAPNNATNEMHFDRAMQDMSQHTLNTATGCNRL